MYIEGIGSTLHQSIFINSSNWNIPKKWQVIWYFVTLTHMKKRGEDIEGFGAHTPDKSSKIFYSYPSMIERDFDKLDEQRRIVDQYNCYEHIFLKLIEADNINYAINENDPLFEHLESFFRYFNTFLDKTKILRVLVESPEKNAMSTGKSSENIQDLLVSKKEEFLLEISKGKEKCRKTKKILTKVTALHYCKELEKEGLLFSHNIKAPRQGSKTPHYFFNYTFDGFKKLLKLMFTILPENNQISYLNTDYMKDMINERYIRHILSKKGFYLNRLVPLYTFSQTDGLRFFESHLSGSEDKQVKTRDKTESEFLEYIEDFNRWIAEGSQGRLPQPYIPITYPILRLKENLAISTDNIQKITEKINRNRWFDLNNYPSIILNHYSTRGYEFWKIIYPILLLLRISPLAVKHFFLDEWQGEEIYCDYYIENSEPGAGQMMGNLIGKAIQQITPHSFRLSINSEIKKVSINPNLGENPTRKPGTLEIENDEGVTVIFDIHKICSQSTMSPYLEVKIRSYPSVWELVKSNI